eukprot:6086657-Heterocapsa_arctica.AAC.1
MCFSLQFGGGTEVADPDIHVAPFASQFEPTNTSQDDLLPDRRRGGELGEEGVFDKEAYPSA